MNRCSPLTLFAGFAALAMGSLALTGGSAAARAATAAEAEYRKAMNTPADSAEGRELYQTCAACHGDSGAGSSNELVPRIAGQHFSVIIRQLVDYRHARRSNERMQAATVEHRLPDAQAIANVATHVNLLRISGPSNKGTGLMAQEGVRIYEASCAQCHGAGAQGSDPGGIPRLAGQNYGYLVRQFNDIARGLRPGISRRHVRLLQKMEYQEIVALSDYLSQVMW